MNIHGVDISEAQQTAGVAAMQNGRFKAAQITQALLDAGVPEKALPSGRSGAYPHHFELCAYRAADRLIQQERKKGTIVRDGQFWQPAPVSTLESAPRRRRTP
jgi:hypothetical protein